MSTGKSTGFLIKHFEYFFITYTVKFFALKMSKIIYHLQLHCEKIWYLNGANYSNG